MTSSLKRRLALAFLLSSAIFAAHAQVSITSAGTPYTQDFDSLATSGTTNTWTDNSTLAGWYSQFSAVATNPTTYRADAGTSNTGAIYSYGSGTTTERAFGSVSSGTPATILNAVRFVNNTGSTITSLDISYTGEQWRDGGAAAPNAQSLSFEYQIAGAGTVTDANTPSTGWTAFPNLDFTSPTFTNTASGVALDGNNAANRSARSANLAVTVAPGEEIWLRWRDANDAGNDHGLAIDDLSVTANTSGGGTPVVSFGSTSAAEGDSGTSPFFFTITASQAPATDLNIGYTTVDGTATTADNDYVAKSGTATIAAGTTSVTISVDVNGDTTPEPNETFNVVVSNAGGAVIGNGTGTGTINNDDVTITKIHDVQGSGLASPMTGLNVTVEGIVTATTGSGYFVQEEDADADGDIDTSEGIFVFTSSAPPAAAAVGNKVRAYGQVQEYVPSGTFNQSYTELGASPVTTLMSTGNALPASIDLNYQLIGIDYGTPVLERFEAMRVSSSDLDIVSPSGGSIDETNDTATSDGSFFAVIPGVARPFRETGVPRHELDVAAANAYAAPKYDDYNGYTGPVFDENWERIRVRATSPLLSVGTGDAIGNLQGVIDVYQGNYTLLVDPTSGSYSGPIVVADHAPTAARMPADDEITVSGANLERFWDTVDAPGKSDEVPTPAAYANRLAKDARVVCRMMHAPDIFGAVEVENITVLQDLATAIDDTANSGCPAAPHYQAYLMEGNDIGGIDVGYLVKTAEVSAGVPRVTVNSVTQVGKDTLFTNPDNSTELLNDRPSLILDATVNATNGAHEDLTVIVNHLKALSSVNSTATGSNGWGTVGKRNRAKRWEQAKFLANVVQGLQVADPNKRIVMVGDFNSFQFNDGLVDVMGIITGTASTNDSDTILPGDGGAPLVDTALTNLIEFKPAPERYSYSFDGNAQVLDQALINQPTASAFLYDVDHPRINGDFPVSDFGDYSADSVTRISDHDPVVVYLATSAFQSADLQASVSASSSNVQQGLQVLFTGQVTNHGPDAADAPGFGFAFSQALPDLHVQGALPSGWTCGTAQVSGNQTTLSCSAASLAPSASATITLQATATAATVPGVINVAAGAYSQTADPGNYSNDAQTAVNVYAPPPPQADLSVGMTRTGVATGSVANFRVPVKNAGPDAADNVHVVITGNVLRTVTTLTQPSGWTCRRIAYDITVHIECDRTAAMPSGRSETIAFSAMVPRTGTLQFNASVSSNTVDPNSANNAAGYTRP